MRLSRLAPELVRTELGSTSFRAVATLGEANGLFLLCPKCWLAEGESSLGVHHVLLWTPEVPLGQGWSGPGRWEFLGSSLEDLTLRAGSSSVLLQGGCGAHFFITEGEVLLV